MIEFNGYISGNAEKHYISKSRKLGQNFLLGAVLIFLPIVIFYGIRSRNWALIGAYCSLLVIVPLLAHTPHNTKEQKRITPKRIYTEEDCIFCVADKYVESRLISEVKEVRDYGDFYELVFPFGKISDKFICQKNLLAQGTLDEFEFLFDGKIVRQ